MHACDHVMIIRNWWLVEFCDKEFTNAKGTSSLKDHMMRRHGGTKHYINLDMIGISGFSRKITF